MVYEERFRSREKAGGINRGGGRIKLFMEVNIITWNVRDE